MGHLRHTILMDQPPHAIRQPNGDLLIPAPTAQLLEQVLRRLQDDLSHLHGKRVAEAGSMETSAETANRQDWVDKLSATEGLAGPSVQARHLPETYRQTDSTEPLDLLRALSGLLFERS